MKTVRNIPISLLILISARLCAEPIGDIITYQGKVLNADGTPMTGNQTAKITIKENGTQKVYQEIPVILIGGVFNTFINVGTLSFDPLKEYKIKVEVGGSSTEEKIASVPVAQVAKRVSVDNISGAAWTAYTPTFTGFSVNPTVVARYMKIGRMVTVSVRTTVGGTSSSVSFTVSAPFAAQNSVDCIFRAPAAIVNNGVTAWTPGHVYIGQGDTVFTVNVDWSGALFNSSERS